MKRCSKALIIREMKIKIIMQYHFIPSSVAITTTRKKISIGKNVEKLEHLYSVGVNVK